jgi:D-amino-acid dehydrogenase
MKKIYDVAIIGAGIVGMSTALKLQEKGKNVLVLDKEKSPQFINLVETQG